MTKQVFLYCRPQKSASITVHRRVLRPISCPDSRRAEKFSVNNSKKHLTKRFMLEKAFPRFPDGGGLILHSDQGWQYQNARYQKRMLEKGIRQSMSRKGNCLDNAVMENFFSLLQLELLYLRTFQSLDEFCRELAAYLESYNRNRIKEKLNGLSPVQYRI